jgi:uncharacterized protein YprB with RNaseH-like and TPR domain
MKIINKTLSYEMADSFEYPLEKIARPEDILFTDIETTGLSSAYSAVYLIGCAYYENGSWQLRQYFSDKNDEVSILTAFIDFSSRFKTIIHFNGNRFDLPFLKKRAEKHNLCFDPDSFSSLDIYKKISPYKSVLGLADCKQKSIESFLNIAREDEMSGGDLIEIYKRFITAPNQEAEKIILLHNADDVRGMLMLTRILWYSDFFDLIENAPLLHMRTDAPSEENLDDIPLRAIKVQADYYNDMDGISRQEIFMKLQLPFPLPAGFSCRKDNLYFKTDGSTATIRIPLLEDELKYFYSDYKNYYYLPDEDVALHKSVAVFVDRSHRQQAKAENCYTRKPGQFLQEWDMVFTPFFKKNYKDHTFYFELTDELKTSRAGMSLYAVHCLAYIMA